MKKITDFSLVFDSLQVVVMDFRIIVFLSNIVASDEFGPFVS